MFRYMGGFGLVSLGHSAILGGRGGVYFWFSLT